jgi:hypothetical protein
LCSKAEIGFGSSSEVTPAGLPSEKIDETDRPPYQPCCRAVTILQASAVLPLAQSQALIEITRGHRVETPPPLLSQPPPVPLSRVLKVKSTYVRWNVPWLEGVPRQNTSLLMRILPQSSICGVIPYTKSFSGDRYSFVEQYEETKRYSMTT